MIQIINISEEFGLILKDIIFDLEIEINEKLIEYITDLLSRSVTFNDSIPDYTEVKREDLYKSAECYLLKATIFSDSKKDRKINQVISEEIYQKIFELYDDELAYEICLNINDIVTTLDSVKFYKYKDNIEDLLSHKNTENKYLQRRLSKYMFLNIFSQELQ